MEATFKKFSLNIKGKLHEFNKPVVMGVINITDDSYYAGSRTADKTSAFSRCTKLIEEGATIIDVGAISTRPGSLYQGAEEENKRLMSVFPLFRKEFPETIFSIDTSNAEIARQMLDEGADIINDISAGEHDADMFPLIAERKCPYIIMHMRGRPVDMQNHVEYDDIIGDINKYFLDKIERLHSIGISDILIDPGFGFSKTTEQNYFLLNKLQVFKFHNKPLVVGISRKSMVYKALGSTPENVLPGTIALQAMAILKGADILRVHDVDAAMQCLRVLEIARNSEKI